MTVKPSDRIFVRTPHRCPPWLCFTFDNVFRRWIHDPGRRLGRYVSRGQTALDLGPGKGYFTVPLARMVGEGGSVIAADIDPVMLKGVMQRARRARVERRIEPHLCGEDGSGLERPVDFALMFWMLHEVPDSARLLREVRAVLKPGGRLLLVEPRLHVSPDMFERQLRTAAEAGFRVQDKPRVSLSRAAVLA